APFAGWRQAAAAFPSGRRHDSFCVPAYENARIQQQGGRMIRVLIAEDHLMVRSGIRALLEKSGDLNILGEASNGQEAVEMVEKLRPDVLIMDIMMPRLNGIQ